MVSPFDKCNMNIEAINQQEFLQVLPPSTHDRRLPIRCLLCTSQKQPLGKIFEAHMPKPKVVTHFIRQHCKTARHVAAVSQWRQNQDSGGGGDDDPSPVQDTAQLVPCQGFSLTHGNDRVCAFKKELVQWARSTKLASALSKHIYSFNVSTDELVVHHESCLKLVESADSERPMCEKCREPGLRDPALRSALRFSLKYWAAAVLQSRLFKSPENTEFLMSQLKETVFYKTTHKRVDAVICDDNSKLQKFVRMSWVKMGSHCLTDSSMEFLESTVKPCLLVNVADCKGETQQLANQFTVALATNQFDRHSLDGITLRILKATSSGTLTGNPTALGILLQCLDMAERGSRGSTTLRKPRQMQDQEKAIVEEAAIMLASNGCSDKLMRNLGFSRRTTLQTHSRLQNLLDQGFPCSAVALLFPEVVDMNFVLIDSLIKKCTSTKMRMALCVDATYLLPMHTCVDLQGRKGFIGGPFKMSDVGSDAPGSFQQVIDGKDLYEKMKANRMSLGAIVACVVTFME